MLLSKRAQSTLEYAVVIAIIAAALIAMQVYIKRGIQGRMKQASDDVGSQFSPGYTNITTVTTSNVKSFENVYQTGNAGDTMATTKANTNHYQHQTSNATTQNFSSEQWGRW